MQTICLWMVTVIPRLYFLPSSPTCMPHGHWVRGDQQHDSEGAGSPLGDISSILGSGRLYPQGPRLRAQEESAKAQGVHDAHWELWRAYGFCHRSSIVCSVCRRLQEHQWSFQNDAPWTLKPHLCHGDQQHGGEEAIVCAQLGASRKEID